MFVVSSKWRALKRITHASMHVYVLRNNIFILSGHYRRAPSVRYAVGQLVEALRYKPEGRGLVS
jgi:hypothetical protein